MATHRLLIAEGKRAAVPGTGYSLAVDAIRQRIASTSRDEFPRCMMTAVLTLFHGKREVASGHAVDGHSLRLGKLAVRLVGQGHDPSSAAVDVDT